MCQVLTAELGSLQRSFKTKIYLLRVEVEREGESFGRWRHHDRRGFNRSGCRPGPVTASLQTAVKWLAIAGW